MAQERIEAALTRIADAAKRIEAAAAQSSTQVPKAVAVPSAAPTRKAVEAALQELDILLDQLQR